MQTENVGQIDTERRYGLVEINLSRLITRINLEMTGAVRRYSVSAKQGDKATRHIIVKLLNEGVEYIIPDGVNVVVNVKKPDGKCVYNTCTYDGSEVDIELTNQMLAAFGTAFCDVEVRTSDDSQVITSAAFEMEIEESMRNDKAILSANEFTELENRIAGHIKDLNDTEAAVKEAESGRVTAENERDAAERIRRENELQRIVKENTRKQQELERITAENERAEAERLRQENEGKYAKQAENYAIQSKSYAVGGTGTRPGEDTDNAMEYAKKAEKYSNDWKGSLLPQGTITFAQLPTSGNKAGHMYNISEAFETDSRFEEGAGYSYPSGTNVYWTQDGKWDCLSGALTMELSQAEYDALTTAEKMNGTIYYIYDGNNSLEGATENIAGLMSPEDKKKLDGIAEGAEVNVQPDWNVTDTGSDAFIKNKPSSLPANGGTAKTISETLPISKGGTGKTTAADGFKALIDGVGTGASTPTDDDWYLCQWANGTAEGNDTPIKRKMLALWNYIKGKLATATVGAANKWANSRNINGMLIDGTENSVNYGICETASNVSAKVVSCPGFALVLGAEITVKFINPGSNATPITLNVNNTGAKKITYRGNLSGQVFESGIYTFRYNGENYEYVIAGAAAKLTEGRRINLYGDVSGNFYFDGSHDVSTSLYIPRISIGLKQGKYKIASCVIEVSDGKYWYECTCIKVNLADSWGTGGMLSVVAGAYSNGGYRGPIDSGAGWEYGGENFKDVLSFEIRDAGLDDYGGVVQELWASVKYNNTPITLLMIPMGNNYTDANINSWRFISGISSDAEPDEPL